MSLVAGLYIQCRPSIRPRADQQSLTAANIGYYDDTSERKRKEERERKEKKEEEKRKAKEAKEAEKVRQRQEEEARRKKAARPKGRPFNFEQVRYLLFHNELQSIICTGEATDSNNYRKCLPGFQQPRQCHHSVCLGAKYTSSSQLTCLILAR